MILELIEFIDDLMTVMAQPKGRKRAIMIAIVVASAAVVAVAIAFGVRE